MRQLRDRPKTNRARCALESVDTAANILQQFFVFRLLVQRGQQGADVVQVVFGFEEESLYQFWRGLF